MVFVRSVRTPWAILALRESGCNRGLRAPRWMFGQRSWRRVWSGRREVALL
jgi:hypothetical protein